MCQVLPKAPSAYFLVGIIGLLSKEVLLSGYNNEGFTLTQRITKLNESLIKTQAENQSHRRTETTHPDELSCTFNKLVTYSTLSVV